MDFPVSEYEKRLERAQRAMSAHRFDALLFTTEAEVRYFSGFRTLFWQSPTRPWFLIVPRTGKPIAVIPGIGEALMRQTWLEDIRCWSSPHVTDDGISLLAAALEPYKRIGMPMGRETSLRMPLRNYDLLRGRLRGAEFLDATDLVQGLRMVKSAAEIEKTAAICAIASRAFARAPQLFSEGQPLDDVFRSFKIELLSQGAEDVPYLVGGAGQGGYADVISPPDGTPLSKGDVLMLDTGSTLEGYFCDFDRNFAIGHVSDAAKRAHETLWRATEAGLAAARPGARICDLHQAMLDVIGSDGGGVGRAGHGLGMQLTESPSLISWDETVLVPGMVLTLEPGMDVEEGRIMVHEENIVVTEDVPWLLTERAPPELPEI
jgi:Xaa-Pro dipeptidase